MEDNVVPVEEMNRRRVVAQKAEEVAIGWKNLAAIIGELRELGVPSSDWVDIALRHFDEDVQQKVGPQTRGIIPFVIDMLMRYRDGGDATAADFGDAIKAGMALGDEMPMHKGGLLELLTGVAPMLIEMFMNKRGTVVEYQGVEAIRPQTLEEEEAHEAARREHVRQAMSPPGHRIKQLIDRLFAEAPKLTGPDGQPRTDQAPALECHVMLKAGGSISGALSTTPEGTLRLLAVMQDKRGGQVTAVEHFFDYEEIADIAITRPIETGAPSPSPIIHTS